METAIKAIEKNIADIKMMIEHYQKESDKNLEFKAEKIKQLDKAENDYDELKTKLGRS